MCALTVHCTSQQHTAPSSTCIGVPRFANGKDNYDSTQSLEAQNVADWMLDVTSAGAAAKLGVDFAHLYAESDLARYAGKHKWVANAC